MAIPQFDSYQSVFERTMSGFNQLTDTQKINVKPKRIAVRSVSQAGQARQVLTRMGVKADQLEEIAILNGIHLDEQLDRRLIKLISE